VRDFAGCDAENTISIKVDIPTADFDLSQDFSNCPPLSPTFTYRGTYEKSIKWEFGDGGVSDILSPSQVYLYPGTYNAKLTVTSPGGCEAFKIKPIVIRGPMGKLEYPQNVGCNNLSVPFRVTNDSDVDEVIWDFGDKTDITKTRAYTHTYTNPGTYYPKVTLRNSAGCPAPVPAGPPLKVIGITPQFSSTSAIFCEQGTATFTNASTTNGTIDRYLWDFGDGNTSNAENPTHTYNSAGAYPVKLTVFTTEGGCREPLTKPSFIVVSKKPDPAITGGDAVCQEGTLNFNGQEMPVAGPPSPVTWFWDFGNGTTSTDPNPPAQIFRVAGQQRVRLILTNSYGCVGFEDKYITVHPTPLVDAGPDETMCLNKPITLNATGAASYVWKTPATGLSCTNCAQPSANPTVTTKYYVTGTSAQGCTAEDFVNINVIQPTTVTTTSTQTICIGQSIQLNATGTTQYRWSPSTGLNNPNIPNPIATPTATTTYRVTGSDVRNCFTTNADATIVVLPYPTVNVGTDVTVPVGTPVPLNPVTSGTGNQYQWTPTAGLSCANCPNPIAQPKVTTSYKLTVTNAGGCSASDAMTITVLCGTNNLFMPNTFSPNGDGINDIYYPRGKGIETVRSLRIFNRWGEMVYRRENFKANDPSASWNGKYLGKELPPDVFVYMIDVVCENQSIVTLKGDIALIR
jgi:gliding motility-associated-like protein